MTAVNMKSYVTAQTTMTTISRHVPKHCVDYKKQYLKKIIFKTYTYNKSYILPAEQISCLEIHVQ